MIIFRKCLNFVKTSVREGNDSFEIFQLLNFPSGLLTDHDMTVYLVIYDRSSFAISRKLYANIRAFIDDAYIDPDYEDMEARRRAWNGPMESAAMPMPSANMAFIREEKAKKRSWSGIVPRKKPKESKPEPTLQTDGFAGECAAAPADLLCQ